jgi:TatA/E family protein of Tat protein translocase
MFGIGFSELILIFIVALLVLGPKRLPEVAKTLGRFYREIKSTMDEVKSVVEEDNVKPYTPPHIPEHTASKQEKKNTWEDEFEEELKKSQKEEYQPKREKISFKKKVEENKEEA